MILILMSRLQPAESFRLCVIIALEGFSGRPLADARVHYNPPL